MALAVGTPAPDLTLYQQTPDGVKPWKASDFAGKKNVVLLFFPAVFTGTCKIEMCTIRDSMGIYEGLDAEVVGISGDLPYSQQAWKKELDLNMTLASDFNHEAVKAYDIEYPVFSLGFHGVPKRAVFVIDKNGIVRYTWFNDNATILPEFNEIQAALKAL